MPSQFTKYVRPGKTQKRLKLTLRIPRETHELIVACAREDFLTMNDYIVLAIDSAVRKKENK